MANILYESEEADVAKLMALLHSSIWWFAISWLLVIGVYAVAIETVIPHHHEPATIALTLAFALAGIAGIATSLFKITTFDKKLTKLFEQSIDLRNLIEIKPEHNECACWCSIIRIHRINTDRVWLHPHEITALSQAVLRYVKHKVRVTYTN